MRFGGPRRRVCLALAAIAFTAAAVRAADTRPIAETDLFRFVWVADPEI
jgi:hypothetical protein